MTVRTSAGRAAHWLLVVAIVTGPLYWTPADAGAADVTPAADVLLQSAAPGGVCLLVQPNAPQWAVSIAQRGPFVVHVLMRDARQRDVLRRSVRDAGRGAAVSVHDLWGAQLPYQDNLVNLLVVDHFPALQQEGLTLNELLRVTAPLGTIWCGAAPDASDDARWLEQLRAAATAAHVALVEEPALPGHWVRISKPWPAEIDQWTHFLHGADGNPVAQDQVVGPPRHYQWTGGPVWLRSHETDSSISTMVTAAGRLFYIVDEAPISVAGDHELPDKWSLAARDAFNGVPLWKVPIRRWGWREWKPSWFSARPGDYPFDIRKRLVAVQDRVYVTLGYHAPVTELDARTGDLLRTFDDTQDASEVLVHAGRLYVSVHREGKLRVLAVDLQSGTSLWQTEQTYQGSTTDYLRWTEGRGSVRAPTLSPAANLATDGSIIALIDDDHIVGLDAQSGQQLWRSPFPLDEKDGSAGRIKAQGKLWNGTMIVCDGVVLHASPHVLGALRADTGALLWTQPKKYIGHLWYEWKDVFVIGDLVWTWSSEFEQAVIQVNNQSTQRQQWPKSVIGYDLHTGQLVEEVPVGNIFRTHHHHRCYRNKATVRYILASRRGTEFVDLVDGQHTVDNWVRGTCHVGMMPANGLQYVPPHPCQCYIQEKLVGMNALAAQLTRPDVALTDQQRLQRGRGDVAGADDDEQQEQIRRHQWPAFRHDSARTGAVDTQVPDQHQILWSTSLEGPLSAPTVADGRLYLAQTDQHQVVCLDTDNGAKLWEFIAEARVDSPPTYYLGRVLFGSRDGWLYCLDAATGQLIWRYHVAPTQRWLGAFDQLESAWPIHGSVLVQEGTVYCAAGRSSELDGGLYLVGLDAVTGQVQYSTRLEGPHYTVENVAENYNLPMGALPDVLVSDGQQIYMRSLAFDQQLQAVKGQPELRVDGGYLEDSYFKRTPWRTGRSEYGRMIVHDKRSAYYVRQFDTLRGLDPTVFFTPGQQGYLLFASNLQEQGGSWRLRIPVRIRAMVLTSNQLFVAGPPDVVKPQDPLGAFEGRQGGELWVLEAESGVVVAKHSLPAPPVFNGTAAAAGRFYLVDEHGGVQCFGTPRGDQ